MRICIEKSALEFQERIKKENMKSKTVYQKNGGLSR